MRTALQRGFSDERRRRTWLIEVVEKADWRFCNLRGELAVGTATRAIKPVDRRNCLTR